MNITFVLIPGLVSDARVWEPVAEAIGSASTVHADVQHDSSIEAMAAAQLARVDGPICAIGHSMGGRVALEMARLAPERVVGLVLANTGHHPKREGEEIKRQAMIDLGHDSMEKLVSSWLPPMVNPDRHGDTDLMESLGEMVLQAGPDVHERQIRALIGRPNATAYLGEIRCPVLLVAARHDGWSPIAQHQEIADAIADAELVVIEDAGHFAPVERPAETAAAITEWISRKFGENHE